MMIGKQDYEKAETDLRALMSEGMQLGDAIRIMHRERRVGLMLLWPAVASMQNVSKEAAKRIVARETAQ